MASSALGISAVVINYNGEEFLRGCLQSLQRQSRPPDEILVVDNASTDGSLGILSEKFPDVRVLALPANLGFAEACNRGIEATDSDLVAILNNDLILDREWLNELLKHVSEEWGAWASLILFERSPNRVDSAGDGMSVIGAAFKIGHTQDVSAYRRPREVFGPCAAAALYRRSLLEEAGGFDSDFFLIHEDSDLNLRARMLGFRCLFVPTAQVFHRVNASIESFSAAYVFYGHRNSEILFWKNMPSGLLLTYLPERLLFNLLALLYFTFKGRGVSFLHAKLAFLKQLGSVLRKRRGIQQGRKLSAGRLRRQLERNWLKHRRKGLPKL